MRKIYDPMEFQPGMQQIDSDIFDRVIAARKAYQPEQYTARQVKAALQKEELSFEDFAALLSPAAQPFLEQMARRAKTEREKHFGNNVLLFTPLYISNYCENQCVYCGFNCKNAITRCKLNAEEIEAEMQNIAKTGMREVLLLTGESRSVSGPEYIAEAVRIAKKYFSTIGLEVYPMNADEYAMLRECGADFVTVFQETYDLERYGEMHVAGAKRCFPYRVCAQERALMGGMRGVGFGVLLGLADFRKDMFAAGIHAALLQKKYPHGEIALSFPRLRPYKNHEETNPNDVHETQLLQMMLACRIFRLQALPFPHGNVPDSGITFCRWRQPRSLPASAWASAVTMRNTSKRAMRSSKSLTPEVCRRFMRRFWHRVCSRFIPTTSIRISYDDLCDKPQALPG